jgi:hypothetical protein
VESVKLSIMSFTSTQLTVHEGDCKTEKLNKKSLGERVVL